MKTASHLCAFVSRIPGAAIVSAVVALTVAPAFLTAQQGYQPYPYPASPYGAAPQPQYQQPLVQQPQYGYAQPQYQQPQIQQPQYQQPQVQQPQYAPQQQPYAQQPYPASPDQGLSQPVAPSQALSADQLEQLLAPIALYPDALLAQILTASTYPAQVAVADQWLQQMCAQGYGAPEQIAAGADAQGDWDPSVKALTAFPDVLDMLNHDLDWTTALGDAYYNQPQDVMQTVQVLRQRAQQAGNLQTTPQEDVTQNQGYIDIAPPNPEVVYVPTYDPWDVYGAPIAPYPGFSLVGALGSFFGGLPIQYGLSFALGAFEHTPFGLLAWGLDWLAHSVLFHDSGYFTASASVHDWGLPRGGPRAYNGAYNGWRQNSRAPGGYGNPGYGNGGRRYPAPQNSYQNSYQRGTAYGNRAPAQNYARQPEPTREPTRPEPYVSRGSEQAANGYTHPALPGQTYERPAPQTYAYHPQTYPNRAQTYSNPGYATRSQTFNNPGYGYGYGNRATQQNYATRPQYAYSNAYRNSYPSVRAPQSDSHAYSGRTYEPRGYSTARNESGGFRGFGSQKEPKYSAPKYKAPKGYGGGHEKAPKAPKMSHLSGGGGHHRF